MFSSAKEEEQTGSLLASSDVSQAPFLHFCVSLPRGVGWGEEESKMVSKNSPVFSGVRN